MACTRSGIDVAAAFDRFHPKAATFLGLADDAGVASWLNGLRGSTTVVTLARRLGRSRSSVSRWLSGRCRPNLADFFSLVHAITGRVSDLVSELVDIERVAALASDHWARQSAKRLAFEQPWTEAILRVIETTDYRSLPEHIEGWVASMLGIDVATEVSCLQGLEAAGVITRRDGLYVSGSLTVDTVATPAQMNQLKAHWTQVALRRLQDPRDADIFSYNLMSISSSALEQIQQVIRGAYREIRSIAAAPQEEEVVAQVNLQLLTFDQAQNRVNA